MTDREPSAKALKAAQEIMEWLKDAWGAHNARESDTPQVAAVFDLFAAEATAAERERLLDCAKYDAQMDGPKFMAWDRSALDRLRKEYETSRTAP